MAHCPCKRAESVTRYLENHTSNYLKFWVLNGLMPVIMGGGAGGAGGGGL